MVDRPSIRWITVSKNSGRENCSLDKLHDKCKQDIRKLRAGGALDFMVLNRRYEVNNLNQIDDLTTYIDPQKYIELFADTDLTSQNFWVQTVVQATRRGNYSAKQIPFL